jgi:hypothetical protein
VSFKERINSIESTFKEAAYAKLTSAYDSCITTEENRLEEKLLFSWMDVT